MEEYPISISRACCLMEIYRSYYYYKKKRDDAEVIAAIRSAAVYGEGFQKIYMRLRKQGKPWNHKKVYRVYKLIHYEKQTHLRKRLPARVKHPLTTPDGPNQTWSLDFVSDRLECNRKFRVLNVLDDFGRRAVAQEVSMSMPAERVVKLLEKTIWIHGKPVSIRCDNGPEFISLRFRQWCEVNAIEIKYTQPGHPTQNSYVERFNGSYRRAVLDAYLFRSIEDVRNITEKWMDDYNNNRPHLALGNLTPNEFLKKFEEKRTKTEFIV